MTQEDLEHILIKFYEKGVDCGRNLYGENPEETEEWNTIINALNGEKIRTSSLSYYLRMVAWYAKVDIEDEDAIIESILTIKDFAETALRNFGRSTK